MICSSPNPRVVPLLSEKPISSSKSSWYLSSYLEITVIQLDKGENLIEEWRKHIYFEVIFPLCSEKILLIITKQQYEH
jgi:hypothetical protein